MGVSEDFDYRKVLHFFTEVLQKCYTDLSETPLYKGVCPLQKCYI